MGSMRVVVPLVFLLLASVVAADTDADLTCETGLKNFLPCMNVFPFGEPIPDTCCNALRMINEQGSTKSVRQTICGCIQIVLKPLPPEGVKIFASYPGRCKVNLPYPFDPAFDCNSLS